MGGEQTGGRGRKVHPNRGSDRPPGFIGEAALCVGISRTRTITPVKLLVTPVIWGVLAIPGFSKTAQMDGCGGLGDEYDDDECDEG